MNPVAPSSIPSEVQYDEAIDMLRRVTVRIIAAAGSQGAGVVWSKDGLILTNAHVVNGISRVQFLNGRTWNARLLQKDRDADLALLHIPVSPIDRANIRDSRTLRAGEVVIAVGHPMGEAGAISYGIVHAAPLGRLIEADVRLAPGNSGGPLADAAGRVVGINSMVVNGMGIAVSTAAIEEFIRGVRGATESAR